MGKGEEGDVSAESAPVVNLGARSVPFVYSKDHFTFSNVTLIAEFRVPKYTGAIRCMKREGGLLFCGGDDLMAVWQLTTSQLLYQLRPSQIIHTSGHMCTRCESLVIAGGIMFMVLVPQDVPVLSLDNEVVPGRIEAFNWETGTHLYTLYNGDWRPTGISLRLPNVNDRKGERRRAMIAASFDDAARKGRVMTWTFEVDEPIPSAIVSSSRRLTSY